MLSINQDFLTQIRPKLSPYKHRLCKLGISAGVVAQYVGLTYPYIVNQLNGVYPMTERTESKIKELIHLVETDQL